jgi:hypothetical protein
MSYAIPPLRDSGLRPNENMNWNYSAQGKEGRRFRNLRFEGSLDMIEKTVKLTI